ncbi:hypothetical protein HYQ44_008883 [Verticillium longisporum]|nr:hypothetical protein HYQ44_008883 [Verticillium longisporum]
MHDCCSPGAAKASESLEFDGIICQLLTYSPQHNNSESEAAMNAVLDPDHDPRQNADDNEPTAADPYSSSQAPRRSLSRTNRMDRTGVVLLALVAVIVTCGPLLCMTLAPDGEEPRSCQTTRSLAIVGVAVPTGLVTLTAVGGCSNSLGAERLAGSGWGTLGDRSTTTASGIGVGVGVGVGADGVLIESRTPQGANSSCPICLGSLSSSDTNIDGRERNYQRFTTTNFAMLWIFICKEK